jgi:hypothetical protein
MVEPKAADQCRVAPIGCPVAGPRSNTLVPDGRSGPEKGAAMTHLSDFQVPAFDVDGDWRRTCFAGAGNTRAPGLKTVEEATMNR